MQAFKAAASGRGLCGNPARPAARRTRDCQLLQPLLPHKAVAIWHSLDDHGHAALIRLYLERAGFHDITTDVLQNGSTSDPLVAVYGRR